jgi:predicted nucleotide-binding protein
MMGGHGHQMKTSKIKNNALKILDYLIDKGAMAGKDIKLREIFKFVGLPEKEFDLADTYLLEQGYVDGTMGGMDGTRCLTARGVDYYEENRSPLEITSNNQEVKHMPDPKKVFIVHGRDNRLGDDFFSFIRALDLQPIEWSEALKLTGKATPYIGEVIESAFNNAQAVIVLLSPDDEVRLSPELWKDNEEENEKEIRLQARPNVLFEAGMAFGTHQNRTLLIEVGQVKAFSDIAGRHVIRLSNTPEKRNEIAERLKTAGCNISKSGNDWLTTGEFDIFRQKKNEEELFEKYGIYWNKGLKKRCMNCKSPLKYSSNIGPPSILFCSKCNTKFVLKDRNNNPITEQQAMEELKNANPAFFRDE